MISSKKEGCIIFVCYHFVHFSYLLVLKSIVIHYNLYNFSSKNRHCIRKLNKISTPFKSSPWNHISLASMVISSMLYTMIYATSGIGTDFRQYLDF